MNQILATKPVRKTKTIKTKTVKTFFAVSIMIFGFCMVTSGSFAMYKSKGTQAGKTNTVPNTNTVNNGDSNNSGIQIHLSVEEANLHATIIGEEEISFVTYKWDEEEETTVEINSISDDIDIEIPEGEHQITITAVDINNNTKTSNRKVIGIVTNKPKLEVVQDGSQFLITASDEVGLDKLTFILNGQGYLVRAEGAKEKEFRYDLQEGDNTLEVTAYKLDGRTETFNAICHN